jgi:hypothetical protein
MGNPGVDSDDAVDELVHDFGIQVEFGQGPIDGMGAQLECGSVL